MSQSIYVNLPATPHSSYPIKIQSGLLKNISWLPKNTQSVVIITDHWVKKEYGLALECALKKKAIKVLLLSFPAGEKSKNSKTKSALEEKMLAQGFDRDTLILALGGGVVGDLAGFIAATYMRGISYIQIPTTLLAMLDSSVGGKTAIDTPQGKNLIGAFWQPKAVISDIQCLKTLPKKQLINGLIEALKIFLTSDINSLNFLKKNLDSFLKLDEKIIINLVSRAVKLKAQVIERDEKEHHERAILNFGHTIGHALEQMSDYNLLHGYAVAYGILVEAKISELMGLLNPENYLLIKSILARLGITAHNLKKQDAKKMLKITKSDKKTKAGFVNYVLLEEVGKVHKKKNRFAHPVSDRIVLDAFFKTSEE